MSNSSIKFMKYKWLWFGLSAVLILPGIIYFSLYGLKIGIDFKSGSSIEYTASSTVSADAVKDAVSKLDLKNLTVTTTGNGGFIIKTDSLSDDQHNKLTEAIKTKISDAQEKSYTSVGPIIGQDQSKKAIWRVIIASIAIIFYIAWAFRKVPKPANSWRFGVSAVVALIHDLIFVLGVFAILGHYIDYAEIDSLTVTALLTIMGFSVHDTIVVFDRIRENLRLNPGGDFENIANVSISQTLARSLNTSLTVLIVLLALFLLGGESTKGFVLALLIGITVGTYSSIFNATPLLVVWQNAKKK